MAQKTKIRRRSGKKACFVQTSKIFKVFHVRVLIAETVLFCEFLHVFPSLYHKAHLFSAVEMSRSWAKQNFF